MKEVESDHPPRVAVIVDIRGQSRHKTGLNFSRYRGVTRR